MSIEFRCTQCSKLLRVGDDALGKKARCPDCGTIQEVVSPQDSAARPFAEPTSTFPSDANRAAPLGGPPASPANPFGDTGSGGTPFGSQGVNPYQAPATAGSPTPMSRATAMDRVRGPAIGMLVAGIVSLVLQLVVIGAVIVTAISQQGPTEVIFFQILGQSFGMAASLLMIAGAVKMKNLSSYPLAMAGTIVAMLPCGSCCVISLPFGIWGLIVLLDNQVKSCFE